MIKTGFAFADETGTLNINSSKRYFAIGAIIDCFPDNLIVKLHNCHENLISTLGKSNHSRLEFKFNEVTVTALPIYVAAIDCLLSSPTWRFCSLVIDREDPDFIHPNNPQETWECYLRYLKLLLQRNLSTDERVVLVADFYNKPAGKVHDLATLPQVVPQLTDTLQVESQGLLLVQMADVLLGGSLYAGSDKVKTQLAKKVKYLQQKIGRSRFNQWNMRWRKIGQR